MNPQIYDSHFDRKDKSYCEYTQLVTHDITKAASNFTLSSSPCSISSSSILTRPYFDELPLQPDHPKGSAWGLWGPDDERGTLNLLTEAVVRAAGMEVIQGKVVNLKYVERKNISIKLSLLDSLQADKHNKPATQRPT